MKITLEQVRKAMKELVESKPEGFAYKDVHEGYRYGTGVQCRYVIGGGPGCIVGQVGHMLGMSIGDLTRWEGFDASAVDEFDKEAQSYLQDAQTVQDRGFTWALAYQAAEMLLILGTRVSNREFDR